VALRGDELIGFQLTSSRTVGGRRYLVFHATAIRSEQQNSGVAYAMTARTVLGTYARERSLRLFIVGRFFSPLAFAGAFVTTPDLTRFYPNVESTTVVRTRLVRAVSTYVEAFYPTATWDPTTSVLVVPDEMPAPSFLSRSGTEVVDQWWDQHVEATGGSVVCANEVTPMVLVSGAPLIVKAALRELRLRRGGASPRRRANAGSHEC
jgi:hypothetical protein